MTSIEQVDQRVAAVADRFATNRDERLGRTALDPSDFDALRDAGFLLTAVPEQHGGVWTGFASTTRPTCTMLRTLARVDPSVALVSSMHPSVLGFWLAVETAPDPSDQQAWDAQRAEVFGSAADGAWWGTITSEPGSGGDVAKTKAVAEREGDGWAVSGMKHFGSGSGVTSFMITTARPEGEDKPDTFYFDMRDRPWDGTAGVKLVGEWDGWGMSATQSHAMSFEDCPATRFAALGPGRDLSLSPAGPSIQCYFSAVVLGVAEAAVAEARSKLEPKAAEMRPWEQVEWARAVNDLWVFQQAHEGALRAIESGGMALPAAVRAKLAGAELAESCLTRIMRVVGGGTFSQRSPFGRWALDVKALGFLRPPWGLASDAAFALSFAD